MSNSTDDIQVGDLWEYEGDTYVGKYLIIITKLVDDRSVYITYPNGESKPINITVSYLRKKYRKIA
jgi:hypothetical protein